MTSQDKKDLIVALKTIDVKRLEVDHPNESYVKWFRFGSHIGIDMAIKVIQEMPEEDNAGKDIRIS